MYSLHQFIKLACEGQTVALDMLHAPVEMVIDSSEIWATLCHHREKFYSKNLNAFVGYTRKQAAKYGIKGSRLSDIKHVIEYLAPFNPQIRLGRNDIWMGLPEGEHITKHPVTERVTRMLEVCGRKVHDTCTLEYALKVFRKYEHNYGDRAKKAEENEGIDWKAVSHAIRAAMEVQELLSLGTITLPLRHAATIKAIKQGEMDYMKVVGPMLDALMEQNEILARDSSLPEKVDRTWWDEWLVASLRQEYSP